MKQVLFILIGLFAFTTVEAQKNLIDQVEVGDVLILGKPSSAHYKFVDVPRKNFIIKRGGIANISALNNQNIIITDVWHGKNPKVTFKRADGKKFFRTYKTLTANLDKAVASGELKLPNKEQG